MIKADLRQIADLPNDWRESIRKGKKLALAAIESAMVQEAPHRSGNLVGAITSQETERGGMVYVSGAAPYAPYVHEGTGIFGPSKKPITPVKGKALMFGVAGGVIFRRSVKGSPANPFADRAIRRAQPVVDAIFREIKP